MKGNTPPPWHVPEHSVPHTYSLNTLQNTLLKPSSHTELILYDKLFLKKKQKGNSQCYSFSPEKISILFFFFSFTFCGISHVLFGGVMSSHFKETWKAGSFKNLDVFSLLLTCYSSQFFLLPIIKGSHSGWTSELLVDLLKSYRCRLETLHVLWARNCSSRPVSHLCWGPTAVPWCAVDQ